MKEKEEKKDSERKRREERQWKEKRRGGGQWKKVKMKVWEKWITKREGKEREEITEEDKEKHNGVDREKPISKQMRIGEKTVKCWR